MSDFLGNLAAKNLDLAQALQPRLGSRFEPLHPAGGLAPGGLFNAGALESGLHPGIEIAPARSPSKPDNREINPQVEPPVGESSSRRSLQVLQQETAAIEESQHHSKATARPSIQPIEKPVIESEAASEEPHRLDYGHLLPGRLALWQETAFEGVQTPLRSVEASPVHAPQPFQSGPRITESAGPQREIQVGLEVRGTSSAGQIETRPPDDVAGLKERGLPPVHHAGALRTADKSSLQVPELEIGQERLYQVPAPLEVKSSTVQQATARQTGLTPQPVVQSVTTGRILARPEIKPSEQPVEVTPSISTGQSAQPTEAVVHVTIGRIEVRAMLPPAALKPEVSTKQPPLGLGEYLQRYGGKR